jgi:flagellar motor switch protein FliM
MAEAKKAETEAEAPAAKPKGKLILFIAIGVLVLVLIGGGATYFLMKKKAPAEGEDGEDAQAEVKPKKKDKKADHSVAPSFHKFDKAFTVKLQTEQQEAYLQAEVQLRVLDAAALELLKQYDPELKHRIMLILLTKKMSQDFLSQEEVDALLKGVTGEADEAAPEADNQDVKTYDLGRQERIVRGRMPTLELINERFARYLRIGLFNYMHRSTEVSVGPIKVQKYSEFIRNLVVPTNLNLVQAKPLRGTGLIVFDPNLVFLVVDNMFGGDGRFHTRVEGRDFTPTEQRIIQGMLNVVFEEYEKAWKPVYPLNLRIRPLGDEHPVRQHRDTLRDRRRRHLHHRAFGQHRGNAFLPALLHGRADPRRALQHHAQRAGYLGQALDGNPDAPVADRRSRTGGQARQRHGHLRRHHQHEGRRRDTHHVEENVPVAVDGVPVVECRYGTQNGQYA